MWEDRDAERSIKKANNNNNIFYNDVGTKENQNKKIDNSNIYRKW